jgi:hypothetical protein
MLVLLTVLHQVQRWGLFWWRNVHTKFHQNPSPDSEVPKLHGNTNTIHTWHVRWLCYGKCCLHIYTLKTEATRFSEMSINFYRTARRHIRGLLIKPQASLPYRIKTKNVADLKLIKKVIGGAAVSVITTWLQQGQSYGGRPIQADFHSGCTTIDRQSCDCLSFLVPLHSPQNRGNLPSRGPCQHLSRNTRNQRKGLPGCTTRWRLLSSGMSHSAVWQCHDCPGHGRTKVLNWTHTVTSINRRQFSPRKKITAILLTLRLTNSVVHWPYTTSISDYGGDRTARKTLTSSAKTYKKT